MRHKPTAELENELVELIRPALPNCIVEASPTDPEEYALLGSKGAVLVRYNGSSYREVMQGEARRQREWMVLIGARSLRAKGGHQGVYEYLDAVRETLTDAAIQPAVGAERVALRPLNEGLVTEKDKVWWYAITFAYDDTYL